VEAPVNQPLPPAPCSTCSEVEPRIHCRPGHTVEMKMNVPLINPKVHVQLAFWSSLNLYHYWRSIRAWVYISNILSVDIAASQARNNATSNRRRGRAGFHQTKRTNLEAEKKPSQALPCRVTSLHARARPLPFKWAAAGLFLTFRLPFMLMF
jgi:hypothetical protein